MPRRTLWEFPLSGSLIASTVALLVGCASPAGNDVAGSGGSSGAAAGSLGASGGSGAGGTSGGGSGTGGSGGAGLVGAGGSSGNGGVSAGGGSAGMAGAAAGGGASGNGGVAGGAGSAGESMGGAGQGGGAGGARGGRGGGGAGGAQGGSDTGGSAGAAGNAGASGDGNGGRPPMLKKFVGNIDTRGQVRSDLATYWDQLTPENAGKWGNVERTKDQMNWTALDAMQSYAKDHNIPFKQHNFIWGSQQPSWISGLSQTDQRAQVEEWIRLYCERYPDTPLIDVVNEPPPHTTPPYLNALGGAGMSGYDWIVQAFKWAHQYCPNSILILNDYNNIENSNDNNRTIDMVKKVLAAGGPINAVGAQSHAVANLSANTVKGYIDKITSETGLPVYVSEFDLNIADDNKQQQVMQSLFTMFWDDDNVKGITLWGYIEGSTWETNSGLMSSSGQMRPAMTWLMNFLGRQ